MQDQQTLSCAQAIQAWQQTLSRYEWLREQATTAKDKAWATRNIKKAKETILAYEKSLKG